jgi:hypothetical protein
MHKSKLCGFVIDCRTDARGGDGFRGDRQPVALTCVD